MNVVDLDVLLVTMGIDVTVIKSKCQFLFRLFYIEEVYLKLSEMKR